MSTSLCSLVLPLPSGILKLVQTNAARNQAGIRAGAGQVETVVDMYPQAGRVFETAERFQFEHRSAQPRGAAESAEPIQ